MIFYTICFSLGDPKNNQYIYSLLLLVKTMKKTRMMQSGDVFYIITDPQTSVTLSTFQILSDAKLILLNKPESVYDGMKWKYLFPGLVKCSEDIITYIDVDFLALKPLRVYLPPDYICVYPEGKSDSDNYTTTPNAIKEAKPNGYTAGFFSYRYGPSVQSTFAKILKDLEQPKKFYCLDQPYFNDNLDMRRVIEFDAKMISFNGHTNMPNATLLNCCGDPGNSYLHFAKQFQFYLQMT